MKKYLILAVFMILGLFACNNSNPNIEKNTSDNQQNNLKYHFKSEANGMADIYIKVMTNNTFELSLKILEDNTQKLYLGKTEENKDKIILKFGAEKPSLSALFDEQYDSTNAFEVLNDNDVAISKNSTQIFIWGTSCTKSEN